MQTTRLAVVLCSCSLALAQESEASLAEARRLMGAGQWPEAHATLRTLANQAVSDADLDAIATAWLQVGVFLRDAGQIAEAGIAHEWVLKTQQKLHRGADAPELVASLCESARTSAFAGQWPRAMERYEAALAMSERLGERADVAYTAAAAHGVGSALLAFGKLEKALPLLRRALEMRRAGSDDRAGEDLAATTQNLALCLLRLGRPEEALPLCEAVVVLEQRLHGDTDHAHVAASLGALGTCLQAMQRPDAALPHVQRSFDILTRLHAGEPHPELVSAVLSLATCLMANGQADRAIPHCRAMIERLDAHPDSARARMAAALAAALGRALMDVDRAPEALPWLESALARQQEMHGDEDDAEVAQALLAVAFCRGAVGQSKEAQRQGELAVQMARRVHGTEPHPDVADALSRLGVIVLASQRADEALPKIEESLAMYEALHPGIDHEDVARSRLSLADCLWALGAAAEAVEQLRAGLAIYQRLPGDQRVAIAIGRGLEGNYLLSLDRPDEAVRAQEQSLALWREIAGNRDDSGVASARVALGRCLVRAGKPTEALEHLEAAVAFLRRHRSAEAIETMEGVQNLAACLADTGETDRALELFREAKTVWRRLFPGDSHMLAAALLGEARCLDELGKPESALGAIEAAVDMVGRVRAKVRIGSERRESFFDYLKQGGMFERQQRIALELRQPGTAMYGAERVRARSLLDLFEEQKFDPLEEAVRRAKLRGDEVRAARIRAVAQELTEADTRQDQLLAESLRIATHAATDAAALDTERQRLAAESMKASEQRGRLADERARLLAEALPVGQACRPEAIQAALREGEMLLEYTLTQQVAVLYVLSAEGDVQAFPLPGAMQAVQTLLPPLLSAMAGAAAARGREPGATPPAAAAAPSSRELFTALVPVALWPRLRECQRVFVAPHRELNRLPFEMLVTDVVDGQPVHWLDAGPPIAYVASGSALQWLRARDEVASDAEHQLGMLAIGDPRPRGNTGVGSPSDPRSGDLERIARLTPLAGARAETEAIVGVFKQKELAAQCLLGAEATESAVFELAPRARHLHFACHGVAGEHAGRLVSTLLLSLPERPVTGDDGLLQLDDLLHRWRGRLTGCRLVVLSACDTNVGRSRRDDTPHALPLGFLFAGASAVITSLWPVDDESTRELMTDFYGHLLADERGPLHAFHAARQRLRARHPDPRQWAPFQFLGNP